MGVDGSQRYSKSPPRSPRISHARPSVASVLRPPQLPPSSSCSGPDSSLTLARYPSSSSPFPPRHCRSSHAPTPPSSSSSNFDPLSHFDFTPLFRVHSPPPFAPSHPIFARSGPAGPAALGPSLTSSEPFNCKHSMHGLPDFLRMTIDNLQCLGEHSC